MAQTATSALRVAQARDLVYETFRRSHWMMSAQGWGEDDLATAYRVQFATLEQGGAVENRTRAQLLNGPTYSVSGVTQVNMDRKAMRAWESLDKDDYTSLGAGPQLESYMSARLGTRLGILFDNNVRGLITGVTYNTVNGTGNDNSLTTGSGTNHINRAWPHAATNEATVTSLIAGIKDAHMLLYIKNAAGDAITHGRGEVGMIDFHCPIPVARLIVDYLEEQGSLLTQSDVSGSALLDRSIGSRGAPYMGTAYGFARIVGNQSLPTTPGATAHFDSFALPMGGPLVAVMLPEEIDESMFGQGNTDGAYVYRRTVICKWGGVVLRPEHVIRVRATAG